MAQYRIAALIVLMVVVLFVSCELGMNDVLGRSTADPFADLPQAASFVEDYTILVSWKDDEGADEYYLYRAADDSVTPHYALVYQGRLRSYQDTFVISQKGERYLYRLGKRRGRKLFVDLSTPGKAALGVVSDDNLGLYEPNNEEAAATVLGDIPIPANLYYYESNTHDGITLFDEDWYCIDIPAHWKAHIKIDDRDPPAFSSLTWYTYSQRGYPSENISTTTPVEIANTTNAKTRYYFRIAPNYTLFRGMTAYNGGCGKFVYYTIRILDMTQ